MDQRIQWFDSSSESGWLTGQAFHTGTATAEGDRLKKGLMLLSAMTAEDSRLSISDIGASALTT